MIQVPPPDYIYQGKVLKVVDGDTINVYAYKKVGLGMTAGQEVTLRFHGMDAPHPAGVTIVEGLAAKAFLTNLIMGKDIVFTTNKDRRDPWKRYIAVVYVAGINEPVNDYMVRNGHAVYHRYAMGENPDNIS